MLTGSLCVYRDWQQPWFLEWANRISSPAIVHRKLWEWCAITQALFERDKLRPGAKGLGFAVGSEPLSSLYASLGAEIVATDLAGGAVADAWAETGQHASELDTVYKPELIGREEFDRRVTFRHADMLDLTSLPEGEFDFLWSSCALEHLGTLEAGLDFVSNAMRLLKVGGVACHTTEFNISSLDETVEAGGNVLYRRRDFEALSARLRKQLCVMGVMNYDAGDAPEDVLYDTPPYYVAGRQHLKLELEGYVCTSALIVCTRYG